MLEKVSLNGGKYVTAGFQFAVGIKDIPVHIPCKPYVQKLRWASSKFIVLWDVAEKRGWLVKGISALLHLLRASLKYYETDAFSTALLSKYNDIKEPSTTSRDDYAIKILFDERNMKLPIYPEKSEVLQEDNESTMQDPRPAHKTRRRYYRVEDRVEELYETLEKLIDHQTNAAGRAGMKMKAHARRRLEGWDFKDLASDNDPIYPRMTTLHALGKGWVDFIRSIQAVTLFGRGFGEIIRPSTAIACHYWSGVPRHKFYLAACVVDLQQIMETDGDHTANPMKICNGILWYSSNAVFDACQCAKSRDSRHSDFVQTLWPISLEKLLPRREKMLLQENGAVIFGHNVNLKWKWEDVGNPIEGDPDPELALPEDEFHDSAIGGTETLTSGPCDQGLSVDSSNETISLQQSQTPVSSGPASGDGPARLANLHPTTAANTSIQAGTLEIATRKSKQTSFRHRITTYKARFNATIVQRRKGGGKR